MSARHRKRVRRRPKESTVVVTVHGHPAWAIAMQVSQAEQDHHAMLRQRSYELAVERGHIRR